MIGALLGALGSGATALGMGSLGAGLTSIGSAVGSIPGLGGGLPGMGSGGLPGMGGGAIPGMGGAQSPLNLLGQQAPDPLGTQPGAQQMNPLALFQSLLPKEEKKKKDGDGQQGIQAPAAAMPQEMPAPPVDISALLKIIEGRNNSTLGT